MNILETVNRVAPLGLRFWDEVRQVAVGDGLSVTAYPAENNQLRATAFVNRSSVYAFEDMPGLRAFEMGSGQPEFWNENPPQYPFVVEVQDSEHRFLPFSFRLRVPVRGAWEFACDSFDSPPLAPDPLASPPGMRPWGIPLFSSPARTVVPGMAVVRAELAESHDEGRTPAIWALVAATIDGKLVARGLSDEQGRLVLMFPYPQPPEFAPDSPFAQRKNLSEQSWTVQVRAYYEWKVSPGGAADLCELLNQPQAELWDDESLTIPLTSRVLHYGEELVLKSGMQSVLLVTALGSPI